MKYEMIFGDEKLFDGAPDDCVLAARIPDGEFIFYLENNKSELRGSFATMDDGVVKLAMRRIIKEPKRWTWEDKKAGRLPEVGSDVLCSNGKTIYTIEAVNKNENQLCVRDGDDGDLAITYTQYVSPIETPAEKAQREEDEFFLALKKEWIHPKTPALPSVHFEVGARAAYRKLKGGE